MDRICRLCAAAPKVILLTPCSIWHLPAANYVATADFSVCWGQAEFMTYRIALPRTVVFSQVITWPLPASVALRISLCPSFLPCQFVLKFGKFVFTKFIFTVHFSGSGRTIGPVCMSLWVQTIAFELMTDLWLTYSISYAGSTSPCLGQGHRCHLDVYRSINRNWNEVINFMRPCCGVSVILALSYKYPDFSIH